jgi:hypothetical protein
VANQATQINLYAKSMQVPVYVPSGGIATEPPIFQSITPIFCDIYNNDVLVIGGVLCRNNNLIIRDAYRGFIGDFTITDTLAQDDPVWNFMGSRFQLLWWAPSLLPNPLPG